MDENLKAAFVTMVDNDPILKMAMQDLQQNNIVGRGKYFHVNKKIQRFMRKELSNPHVKKRLEDELARMVAEEQRKLWMGFSIK